MRPTGSVSCSNDIFTPLFQVFNNQTLTAQQSNGKVDAGEPFYLLHCGLPWNSLHFLIDHETERLCPVTQAALAALDTGQRSP